MAAMEFMANLDDDPMDQGSSSAALHGSSALEDELGVGDLGSVWAGVDGQLRP